MKYESAIHAMESYVRGMERLRPLRERSGELLGTLEALSIQHRNLEGALLIVLLGGTGVGKSTLLNAIAGSEVAATSPIRPCTTVTTYYSHRENDLSPLSPVISDSDRIVVHEAAGLRGKIVADPPDFDSMLQSNRRKLLEVLKVADLVVVVTDVEKYGNLALYRLLRRFREGRSYLFVMNKADFGIEPSVIEDFRRTLGFESPRIFAVSARERSGQFRELVGVIEEEMDRAAIRRIKNSNLSGIVSHVYGSIAGAIPENFEHRMVEVEKSAERGVAVASERIASELLRALFEVDPRVRAFVLSAASRSVSGPFGLYLAAIGKIGTLFSKRLPAAAAEDPVELRVAVRNALGKADHGRIVTVLRRLDSETHSAFSDAGVDASGILPSPAESAREIEAAAAELAGERTVEFVEKASSGFVGTILYNVVPLAWIGYCIWRLVAPGSERPIEILAFVAVLFAIFILQHPMAERSFRRKGGRFIRRLESELAERIESDLEGRIVPPVRAFAEDLAARTREFRSKAP